MKKIESRTNAIYRSWKSLLSTKGIRQEGSLLVAGRKLVPEFLASPQLRPQCLIISHPADVEKLEFKKSLDVIWLVPELFDEIDEAGTHFPLLLVEAPRLAPAALELPPAGLEVVLSLSNPLNLGAVLRSCEAFGVSQVVLLKECAFPFLPKVIRASSGSALRVKIATGPSLHELNEKETAQMQSLDMKGANLSRARFEVNSRLIIGEEGQGLPENRKWLRTLSIPIKSEMDSLNAGMAASIAMYAYRTQHILPVSPSREEK